MSGRGPTAGGLALLAVILAAGAVALLLGRETVDHPIGAPAPRTPVLSARRVPEVVAAPRARQRLRTDIEAWLATAPPQRCLIVRDEAGDELYSTNADLALVPASVHKLLTATAAVLELEADRRRVAQLLRFSDNEAAAAVVAELASRRPDGGDTDAGLAAMRAVLAEARLDLDGVVLADGSGQSRGNRLTCVLLLELLLRPDTGPVLVHGLAVAGESGTLRDRFLGTSVVGRLRAKTGSLRDIASLAGVLAPSGGGQLTFAYVGNGAGGSDLDARDGLALVLDRHPQWGDLSRLLPL